MKKWLLLLIVIVAFVPVKGFSASIIFGETAGYYYLDENGLNQKRPNAPNAEAARDEFFSNLTDGVVTETFQEIIGLTDLEVDIGLINGNGFIGDSDEIGFGLGPYSGDYFLISQVDPFDFDDADNIRTGGFSIDFDPKSTGITIDAFGFFGSDFGDFDGQVVASTFNDGDTVGSYSIGHWDLSSFNGALLYWGIIEDKPFDLIEFTITQTINTETDRLGFDNFTIATSASFTPPPEETFKKIPNYPNSGDDTYISTIPEPGTMVLFGLGLLSVAGIGRKNRKV